MYLLETEEKILVYRQRRWMDEWRDGEYEKKRKKKRWNKNIK